METMLEVERSPSSPGEIAAPPAAAGLVPAHLHAYRDFARMRSVYPVCLHRADGDLRLDPLAALLDIAGEAVEAETDDAELLRRALLKVEVAIREVVRTTAPLSGLWDEVVERLLAETRADRQERLRVLLEEARKGLPDEATVLALARTVAVRLMEGVANEQSRRLAATTGAELQDLIIRVEQMLASDAAARKTDAATLGVAIGTDEDGDVDLEALAGLIGKAALQNPLPDGRRQRIARALKTIRGLEHVMSGAVPEAGLWSNDEVVTVELARVRAQKRLGELKNFFAAVHVAALEVENRYREGQHDPFFEGYQLAPFERAMCPPVLLSLDAGAMALAERAELLDLLGSELPVKALMTIDTLYDDPKLCGVSWQASLGTMAAAMHHPYVAQVALSEVEWLWRSLADGFAFGGPALFSVFTGAGNGTSHLHPFLRAAAAVEGRAFPVFAYAPSRSREPGERLSVDGNPQVEMPWRVETVSLAAGHEALAEALPFTFADFLACDPVLASHFEPMVEERRVEAMVPLDQYLELPSAEARGRVPFILAADEDGDPVRLLVSNAVVEATRRVATAWRGLQEAAGINSIHTLRAIGEERTRLESEKQQALDELHAAHEAALAESTGDVAERIVSNLAARLLDLTAAPAVMPAPRPAPGARPAPGSRPDAPAPEAAEAATTEPAAAEPAAEDDDAPLSLDEAYIETPRCTTCNECTNINGRMFVYDANKQAIIADVSAGTYREMVLAAEKCPVDIIHPGKPWNPDEPGLDELMKRAEPYL